MWEFDSAIFHFYIYIFNVDYYLKFIYCTYNIKEVWQNYDPDGIGFINYKDFWRFASELAMVYGVKKEDLLDVYHKKNFL